jgi:spermidine synthase
VGRQQFKAAGVEAAKSLSPPISLPRWAALCFFASGVAGLLYETVWSKQLSYLLGSSLEAVATVVAAFLGGLALGARFLGVPLSRRPARVRSYALLELGVAAAAGLLLPALHGLDPLVGFLYRSFGHGSVAFALSRVVLLLVVLVPPAALMGATLPVLVAEFELGRVGPSLARLYALNTFGAVAGSILGGFLLIPTVGLAATTAVAVALNLAAAALAWTRAGRSHETTPDDAAPAPARPADEALPETARRAFVWLVGLSGFAALALQIAWVRLFGLVLGSSVYSFSAVLGVYLLGIAIGSLVIARLGVRFSSLAAFGKIQLGLAALVALQLHAFSRLPGWVFALGQASGSSFSLLFAGELGVVLVLLLLPCALLGAAFPVAARLLQRADGGHATALTYAVNTAGTIAGSLLAGFYGVPSWGVKGTVVAALLVSLAVGMASLVLGRAPRRRSRPGNLRFGAAALVITAGLTLLAPAWDPALMSAGAFRPNQATYMAALTGLGDGSAVWKATRADEVLYYHEGLNSSVIVVESGGQRTLRVGGKIDASSGDMETQILLGLLPATLADRGARSLIIGLGSGFTAAAALGAGVGPTEIVELESGVVEASRFFHEPGRHPLADPRVSLVLGDARTHLAHGAGRYGLVISEPSNPWVAGVNNLFTVDFYRLARARLEPDGVFCQWLQLYELTPATFASLVRSFIEVFPEGHLFAVWRSSDVILVAAPRGRRLALDRLRDPRVGRLLARARISSPELMAAYYAAPLSALAPVAAGAALNSDDRPVVEYWAPRDMVAVGRSASVLDPEVRARIPLLETMPDGDLFADWSKERWFEIRARALADLGDEARATAVVRGARVTGLTELADRLTTALGGRQRGEPGASPFAIGSKLLAEGNAPEARDALERAVVLEPSNELAWLYLADCRQALGDISGAEAALSHVKQSAEPQVRTQAAAVARAIEALRQQAREAMAGRSQAP